uniref:Arginyl-tRNA--protein transferase 1 n=2 Tax=Schistocephalus solidus TaxID=70667 RepID=A0A0X3NWM0_SCHSO
MRSSVVKLYGLHNGGLCGYCKDNTTNKSTYYSDVNPLDAADYKALIDRGWRRSGTMCYKPMNQNTCCPAYTIRCEAINFKISRSQKRILKNMALFLNNGTVERYTIKSSQEISPESRKCLSFNESGDIYKSSISSSSHPRSVVPASGDSKVPNKAGDAQDDLHTLKSLELTAARQSSEMHNTSTVLRSNSARRQRWTRLQHHLRERSLREGVPFARLMQEYWTRRNKRLEKNKPKQLEEYFNLAQPKDKAKHFLEVRLCRSAPRSSVFNSTLVAEHEVYAAYQMAVHGDSADDVKMSQFLRFLVQSPLVSSDSDRVPKTGEGAPSFGSYHQQYWLDGEKLIAVGVVDLLPGCLSSVYLFYHPDYAFLRLGTYAALREIAFVRDLYRRYGPTSPHPDTRFADFIYYYAGYYIHSCQKMRYKALFSPSSLACPETYHWVPVERCIPLLDQHPFARFSDPAEVDEDSVDNLSDSELLSRLQCLLPRSDSLLQCLPSRGYSPWTEEGVTDAPRILLSVRVASRVLTDRAVSQALHWARLVGRICLNGRIKINFGN